MTSYRVYRRIGKKRVRIDGPPEANEMVPLLLLDNRPGADYMMMHDELMRSVFGVRTGRFTSDKTKVVRIEKG